MSLLGLFKIKSACSELIFIFATFVLFFHLDFAGHAGKGSLFVGRVQPFSVGFFFTPCFCQASLIRGLNLAEALLLQGFIYALLSNSSSLPLCLFLSSPHFQLTTMALRRGRIFAAHRTDTSCRTTWRRAQSGKRVSLRGPGWGTAQGCRTPTMAILREGHAFSSE